MIIIFLLIPTSVVVAAAFLGAFILAVRSGQYEDLDTPALRLLMDDNVITPPTGTIVPAEKPNPPK